MEIRHDIAILMRMIRMKGIYCRYAGASVFVLPLLLMGCGDEVETSTLTIGKGIPEPS